MQRELDSVMEQQPIDEGAAQKLILAIAAAQYSAINPNQYETIRLRRLFSKHEPMTELDAETASKFRIRYPVLQQTEPWIYN